MFNLALALTTAKYGASVPDGLIIALWIIPLIPLGYWAYTHPKLIIHRQWLEGRYRGKPIPTLVVGLVVLAIIGICLIGATHKIWGKLSRQKQPNIVAVTNEPPTVQALVTREPAQTSSSDSQALKERKGKGRKAAQPAPPVPASSSISQSNSGGINVQQATTGENSPIINSPITIENRQRSLTDKQKDVLATFYANLSETFHVLVHAVAGEEPVKFSRAICDAMTARRQTFIAWEQSIFPKAQESKGVFVITHSGQLDAVKQLCGDLIAAQLEVDCYEDSATPDHWIIIHVGVSP